MILPHIPGVMNLDLADHDLPNDKIRYSLNTQFKNKGIGTKRRENLLGTTKITNDDLPSGTNKTVGALSDETSNRIVYFNYNSNGDHGVYLYNDFSGKITTLIKWSGLNFTPETNITGIALIGETLVWGSSQHETRSLNLELAESGYYLSDLSEQKISYQKWPYPQRPNVSSRFDEPNIRNTISYDNYRFLVRLTYKDGGQSVLSPYSEISQGDITPRFTKSQTAKVILSVALTPQVRDMLRSVEWIYHKNDDPQLHVFEYIEEEDLRNSSLGIINVTFTNREEAVALGERDVVTVAEPIPRRSSALAGLYNRIFLNNEESGFDVEPTEFELKLTPLIIPANFQTNTLLNDPAGNTSSKAFGEYSGGVVFYDEQMRYSGVRNQQPVAIPGGSYTNAGSNSLTRHVVRWELSGKAPVGAKYAQLFLSNEKSQVSYFQCPAGVLFYKSDDNPGGTNFFNLRNRYYHTNKTNVTSRGEYAFIHLVLPTNIPFTPDTNCYVRILQGMGSTATNDGLIEAQVLDVLDGDILVIDDVSGIGNFSSVDLDVFVEVYLPVSDRTNTLYAASDIIGIGQDRTFNVTFGNIFGDMFKAKVSGKNAFSWALDVVDTVSKEGSPKVGYTTGVYDPGTSQVWYCETECRIINQSWQDTQARMKKGRWVVLEGSRGLSKQGAELSKQIAEQTIEGTDFKLVQTRKGFANVVQAEYEVQYRELELTLLPKSDVAFDYNKIPNAFGRPNQYFPLEQKQFLPNQIRFSNEALKGGVINRIYNFSLEDGVLLPHDRGDVVALVSVVRVLLAVHTQSTSSLYINEGYLKSGEGDLLSKTEGVIGDDRELMNQYGTQNPESIFTQDGKAGWFDWNRADLVRYAANGLMPLGKKYGFASEFQRLKLLYDEFGQYPNVYGGYDPQQDVIWMTFAPITVAENVNGSKVDKELPGFTLGFSERAEGFMGYASFIPERYSKAGNFLFSFKDGEIYRHDDLVNRNNFYGVQYNSQVKFLINRNPESSKIFQHLHLDGSLSGKWSVPSAKTDLDQETNLEESDFQERDNSLYSGFKRDINTAPDLLKSSEIALLSGNKMTGQFLELLIQSASTSEIFLDGVHVGVEFKPGHFIEAAKNPKKE